MNKTFIIWTIT